MSSKPPGKFMVFEGITGVGKATQLQLLKQRIESTGAQVVSFTYPRFDSTIGKLLANECKKEWENVSAHSLLYVALLYSADRYEHAPDIKSLLAKGVHVLVDRYAPSNYVFQAAKITDEKKRRLFVNWLQNVESRLPVPDQIIYLHDASKDLVFSTVDESDSVTRYDLRVRNLYDKWAKKGQWVRIECAKKLEHSWNQFSREAIHEMIWKKVGNKFKPRKGVSV
jgi:dTMP kinase